VQRFEELEELEELEDLCERKICQIIHLFLQETGWLDRTRSTIQFLNLISLHGKIFRQAVGDDGSIGIWSDLRQYASFWVSCCY
jgi:hypothetical protein